MVELFFFLPFFAFFSLSLSLSLSPLTYSHTRTYTHTRTYNDTLHSKPLKPPPPPPPPPPSILTLHHNPLPPLPLSNFKHDLHTCKQDPNNPDGPHPHPTPHPHRRPITFAHQPAHDPLQAIPADHKADQIGAHHHQDVGHGADAADDAVEIWMVLDPVAAGVQDGGGEEFGEDEEGDEPAPDQEAELDVVPDGDEGEDCEGVEDGGDGGVGFA